MRQIFLILILLVGHLSYSCVCRSVPFIDRIERSDFIASVEILEVYEVPDNDDVHLVKISILELFKGEFTDELILGSVLNTSCGFYTPKNTKWLIFASTNKDGKLSYGYCSGSIRLDRTPDRLWTKKGIERYNRIADLKQQVLRFFDEHNLNPENKYHLTAYFPNRCLQKFKGVKIESERFALFQIELNEDLMVEEIIKLKLFSDIKINQQIVNCLENELRFYQKRKQIESFEKTSLIIGVFYYPSEGEYQSFLSLNLL